MSVGDPGVQHLPLGLLVLHSVLFPFLLSSLPLLCSLPSFALSPPTFRVAVAGQAAVSLSLPVKALPAPLAVSSGCVVVTVDAAEPIACLSVELLVKDALSGFPIAITH